jgi:hypothetical protein
MSIFDLRNKTEQEAYKYYEQYTNNVLIRNQDGTFASQGHNNELDAFRHAYVSGVFVLEYGATISSFMGYLNELKGDVNNQPQSEKNMDFWNNQVGINYASSAISKQALSELLINALRKGELITSIDDKRTDNHDYFEAKTNSTIDSIYNQFISTLNSFAPKDPLVIDLNGDGLRLGNWQESGVSFDLDGNGFSENAGWVMGDVVDLHVDL